MNPMYKKLIVLVLCFILLNLGAKYSSFWGEEQAQGLSNENTSIPNGVYVLKKINICNLKHNHEKGCQFENMTLSGTAKISLTKILDGQYWLVFQGYSKIKMDDKDINFGCLKGIIDSHIFFNNIAKNSKQIANTQENETSAISSQVRIFENTCVASPQAKSQFYVCDGNFLGQYSYLQRSKKLLIQQTRMLNGKKVKMFSVYEKT